jgi:chorismate mutase/GNAT superfamily N-acetyltransferase
MPSEVSVRRAADPDAVRIATIHLQARRSAPMPEGIHPEAEVRTWLAERVLHDEVWVAEVGGVIAGYVRLTPTWLDDLYVAPDFAGQGIGTLLLETAKSLRPAGFELWVFVSNEPARRFYLHRGLIELDATDGSANEERAPDLRMAWPGEDPLSFFRGRIDEADSELGQLLERRAALARAVQRFKPVGGHPGRDPERERAIADRVASQAPSLPRERIEGIVEAVISAGLDSGRMSPAGLSEPPEKIT